MMEIIGDLLHEIRSRTITWLTFLALFIGIYIFYYYFTPVYVYVVSSPYVGPNMINGFADAYKKHYHSLMPVKVIDYVVDDSEKGIGEFLDRLQVDMSYGKRIVTIVGTDISSETKMLLSAMSRRGMTIPVISQCSSSPELKRLYPYFFRVIYNDEHAVKAFARWYVADGPAKPVVVLVDSENMTWSGAVGRIFSETASGVVVDTKVVDMSDSAGVRKTLDKVMDYYKLNPNETYVFIVDYQLADLYKITLAISDKYKYLLMTDSAVKFMFTRWFPDDMQLYVYYLPVGKDISMNMDYDYDLAYDTLSLVLDIITDGARTPSAVFRRLSTVHYKGRTGDISFAPLDGVYERQFHSISILKEEGARWQFITQWRIQE